MDAFDEKSFSHLLMGLGNYVIFPTPIEGLEGGASTACNGALRLAEQLSAEDNGAQSAECQALMRSKRTSSEARHEGS